MKFSERWLRDWVDPPVDSAELAEQLTMAGLEFATSEAIAPAFDGVLVAEITALESHSVRRVQLCRLHCGEGRADATVISGMPGLAVGLRVPYAPPGAQLPGGVMEAREIGGVLSEGMICAGEELGLGAEGPPLLPLPEAAPGTLLAQALAFDDRLIELELTPNRGDCLSLLGIAREVAARNRLPLAPAAAGGAAAVSTSCDTALEVELQAPADCPLFCGRVLLDIDLSAHTPAWMRERLRRSGIRAIDPVVDVSNYVMLELGQPMHCYDLARLRGPISVRRARPGEALRLLDDSELELSEEDLLIADSERPLGLAGIMGGAASAVDRSSRSVFLEAAFFDPQLIATRSRARQLQTDASRRFERRVDPNLPQRAIERATALLLDIVGGKPGPVTVARSAEQLPVAPQLRLRYQRIGQLLGDAPSVAEVVELLASIGVVLEEEEDGWLARPPSWRGDLTLEVDLIEEIARLRGYDQLPKRRPSAPCAIAAGRHNWVMGLRRRIAARGFFEVLNFSMAPATWQRSLHPGIEAVELLQPLSQELGELRLSLWSGLLANAQHNQRRGEGRLRLFEIGHCFAPGAEGEVLESERLGLLSCGARWPENWSHAADRADCDAHDLKGELESLLPDGAEVAWRFSAGDSPSLHPGRQAVLCRDGELVGRVGQLHPAIVRELELDTVPCLAELRLDALAERWRRAPLSPPLRSPALLRDLALVVPEEMPAADIEQQLRCALGSDLERIVPFDLYCGAGIPSGHKSLAFRLVMRRATGSFSEEEASVILKRVIKRLESDHGIFLRAAPVAMDST